VQEDAQFSKDVTILDNVLSYSMLPLQLRYYVSDNPLGLEYRRAWDDLKWHPWEEGIDVPIHVREIFVRTVQVAQVMQRVVSRAFVSLCEGRPIGESTCDPENRLVRSLYTSMKSLINWHIQHMPNEPPASPGAAQSELAQGVWLHGSTCAGDRNASDCS